MKLGRTTKRGLLIGAATLAALGTLGGVAFGYWSASSTTPGYAVADSVGTGGGPAASATASKIDLSWPATTTTAGHAVSGYLVSRYSAASGGTAAIPGGTCAAVPVAATACTDTAVPDGTWYYAVTPVLGSWQGIQGARSVGRTVPATRTFALSVTGGGTAGVAATLTVNARVNGQADDSYTGTKTLTFAGPGVAPNGTAPVYNNGSAAVTFTAGVATVPMTLYRAESVTLTVGDGTASGTLGLTVAPAAASQLGVSAPTGATAGTATTVTVSALDAYRNTATAFGGARTLAWSGPGTAPDGTHSPAYPANPVTFTAGVTSQQITLYRAESTQLAVATSGLSGTSASFTVSARAAGQFDVSDPGTRTAGTSFTVTLAALDAYRNAATTYTGAKSLSWTGPSVAPSGVAPTYPANPVVFGQGGTASVPITLTKAELTTLRVTDTATPAITGASPSFTVVPGTAAQLAWSGVSAPTASVSAQCLFTCSASGIGNNQTFTSSVAVTDASGNTVTNLGAGHSVTVATNGGAFTAPTAATSVTLTISATGPAVSTQSFTFKTQGGNWTADTLTASSAGYGNATATVSK